MRRKPGVFFAIALAMGLALLGSAVYAHADETGSPSLAKVQRGLQGLAFQPGRADNKMGPMTQGALKRFYEACRRSGAPLSGKNSRDKALWNDVVALVRKVQEGVGSGKDGDYGGITHGDVNKWQGGEGGFTGTDVDGFAGSMTRAKMVDKGKLDAKWKCPKTAEAAPAPATPKKDCYYFTQTNDPVGAKVPWASERGYLSGGVYCWQSEGSSGLYTVWFTNIQVTYLAKDFGGSVGKGCKRSRAMLTYDQKNVDNDNYQRQDHKKGGRLCPKGSPATSTETIKDSAIVLHRVKPPSFHVEDE